MPKEGENANVPSRLKKYLKEAPFFCKIIQLVFCTVAVGLIVDPINEIHLRNKNHVAVVYVSFCSFILINAVQIVCYLLGERVPKKMCLCFSGLGAVLCLTAGLILLQEWRDFPNNLISRYLEQFSDQMISSAVFGILAAITFAVDLYFINKYD